MKVSSGLGFATASSGLILPAGSAGVTEATAKAIAMETLTPSELYKQGNVGTVWSTPKVESRPKESVLRFSPLAWAKLVFLCHYGDTEVGGFGISDAEDPLHVEDFELIKQVSGPASVEFDQAGFADFVDTCAIDKKLQHAQFTRIWIHTHPGSSPNPSGTDEATFANRGGQGLGSLDWAVMFIMARGGKTYARLRCSPNGGPSIEKEIEVRHDTNTTLRESVADANKVSDFYVWWEEQYHELVQVRKYEALRYTTQWVTSATQPINGEKTYGHGVWPRDSSADRKKERQEFAEAYEAYMAAHFIDDSNELYGVTDDVLDPAVMDGFQPLIDTEDEIVDNLLAGVEDPRATEALRARAAQTFLKRKH